MRDPHPNDLQKACMAFIASLREPAFAHSVYGQTRINRGTGEVTEYIIVHRHPLHASDAFKARKLPKWFDGYRVEEQTWPAQDLMDRFNEICDQVAADIHA